MLETRVLLVDDDSLWKHTVERLLRKENYQVEYAQNLAKAKELLSNEIFELVITNMVLEKGSPILDGLKVLDIVQGLASKTQCIVLTECRDFDFAKELIGRYGEVVYDLITKTDPWIDYEGFVLKCREALKKAASLESAIQRAVLLAEGDEILVKHLPKEMRMSESASPQPSKAAVLRQVLVERFDLEELHTLCVDLSVDYDNLRGEGKKSKARELVAYLQRRGELERLVDAIRRERGDIFQETEDDIE